ncbi:MAG: SMI1/KNR4 family protein [Chitinophagaceae bacterium]|nr:SMI1/KNR4 family protein [Chitinophagaceae bacterium]
MESKSDIIRLLEGINWDKRDSAPEGSIAELRATFGIQLPTDFERLFNYSDGGSTYSYKTPLTIYSTKEIIALYKEADLYDKIPQALIFGGDDGGIVYCYDLREKNVQGEFDVMAVYERTGTLDDPIFHCGGLHELIEALISGLKI